MFEHIHRNDNNMFLDLVVVDVAIVVNYQVYLSKGRWLVDVETWIETVPPSKKNSWWSN